MANLSKSTQSLLTALDVYSGHRLTRREDLGNLIELSAVHSGSRAFDELSFLGKFIVKTHRLLHRVGPHSDGSDQLLREFGDAIDKSKALLAIVLAEALGETRQHFESLYMKSTTESLGNLISLCHDLSWYKNWMIDHKEGGRR